MVLGRLSTKSKTYKPVKAAAGCDREIYIEGKLKDRRYILYVKIEWAKWTDREVIISSYGETVAHISPCAKAPTFITDYYTYLANKEGDWKPY